MDFSLKGKNVIVTGVSKEGIGNAIATKFLEEGANVVITGRQEEKLKEVSRNLGGIKYMVWNILETEKNEDKILQAEALLNGNIDILINNAGVLTERDFKWHYLDLTVEEWDYVMDTNCKGTYFMCQSMVKYMLKRKIKGHILNIASEMGIRPACVTYGISKWGVVGMTKGLGMKLAPKGIVINGIAPGATATKMMNWKEGDSVYRENHPNRRMAFPEEIANLAVFLTGKTGDNIIGEVVICDGGSHLL